MPHPQIFKDTFEASWKDFDEHFRKNLLEKIHKLGSLHRLTLSHEEVNMEFGQRFYAALEETLKKGRFVEKWKAALVGSVPKNFDEMATIFERHAVYPLHAFYLLLIYVHEYPLRSFFSGRDRRLPFNTLTLSFQQALSDPLPTAVGYELDDIQLEWCPGLSANPKMGTGNRSMTSDISITPLMQQGGHPQHHWKDLIWVWHFGVVGENL